ncbi:hypothetical protein LguiB_001051 [Lonicera macranthoides]
METGIWAEMKKKKKKRVGLVRCSSVDKVKLKDSNTSIKKKKQQQQQQQQLGKLSGSGEGWRFCFEIMLREEGRSISRRWTHGH